MKTTIAIIGASGSMGSALARNISRANYRVLLFDKNRTELESLLQSIKSAMPKADVEIMDCARESGWEADIIIPAVWYQSQAEVAEKIREVAANKIVVSIANPLNDTYDGLLTGPSTSAAEELAKLLPNAKIVKAFNTTFAADFATPSLDGKTVDSFIAGDDDEAVQTVSNLVKAVGFNPLVAGKLSVSRTLESMTLLLIGLSMRYNYNWLAGWKILSNVNA